MAIQQMALMKNRGVTFRGADMTDRVSLSRRQFLNASTMAASYGLFGWGRSRTQAADNRSRPNILWLTSEGFRYVHCYSNAAVCAPTRSTWITGMYAISNGTQPMRSRNDIPHDVIPYYPDLLRKAGYHTSNWTKTDYNIGGRPDRAGSWDRCPAVVRKGRFMSRGAALG